MNKSLTKNKEKMKWRNRKKKAKKNWRKMSRRSKSPFLKISLRTKKNKLQKRCINRRLSQS